MGKELEDRIDSLIIGVSVLSEKIDKMNSSMSTLREENQWLKKENDENNSKAEEFIKSYKSDRLKSNSQNKIQLIVSMIAIAFSISFLGLAGIVSFYEVNDAQIIYWAYFIAGLLIVIWLVNKSRNINC